MCFIITLLIERTHLGTMLPLKTIKIIITSTALISLIGGCVPAGTGTSTDSTRPPAPIVRYPEQEPQPQIAPPSQAEQDITTPAEVSSRQPVFRRTEPEQIRNISVSYADVEFVQQRLNEYQAKLDQWLEISDTQEESKLAQELSAQGIECVQLLERILTGYSLLLDRMEQNKSVPVNKIAIIDPKRMQQLDIAFLESRCVETLTRDIPVPVQPEELTTGEEPENPFEEAQKIIALHVSNGNYQEAALVYSSLLENYPGQDPSIFTRLNYGLALQFSGQVEAAASHFRKMLTSGDLSIEPLRLQLEIADLFLASGNITAAESYYESYIKAQKSIETEKSWAMGQLSFLRSIEPDSEEMLAYIELLHEFQVYDYRIHSVALNRKVDDFAAEHAGNPIAESALQLKAFTSEQMYSWFNRQMARVNHLVAERKFTEAADLLKSMTNYYLPADLQAIVQKTYYEVGQAEELDSENQRLLKEIQLNEQWAEAVHLMDSQRFDEAISAFEALNGTELEENANLKIVEAANLATAKRRKEAASLFIQASKTPDIEKKKELLLDSHRMLNEVLVKFPQTDLLGKVNQNLAILEEQISKIDPSLLEMLQQEYSSPMYQESPDPFSSQQ
jgi:tetratricopeptide (TPR) repeat protein